MELNLAVTLQDRGLCNVLKIGKSANLSQGGEIFLQKFQGNLGTQAYEDINPDVLIPNIMVSFLHNQGPDFGVPDLQMSKIQPTLEFRHSHQ